MSNEKPPPPEEGDPTEAETIQGPVEKYAFPPTSLTEVIKSLGDDPGSQKALASLCSKYWYPLYAFLRRGGHSTEDAQDLTQGFFAEFLSGRGFAGFDPERAKLRTYMLGALKHYESNSRREKAALKRGGGYEFVSFDWMTAERWYGAEPAHIDSPDTIFHRRWAITLLGTAHEILRESYEKKDKSELFEALHIFLDGKPDNSSQEESAARLGMSLAATKMAISRMRDQRRQIMRAEIGKTVASPEQIDGEIAHLIGLFQPHGEGGGI
ncbi:MAG: RNA polymerase sigma factor [Verrucomicrobiales bacterium]